MAQQEGALEGGWQVQLLGGARLVHASGEKLLDRRTAGALTYVALEEEVPRERLHALLWPSSPDATASANLRKMLSRLRRVVGAELLVGGRLLRLAPGVQLDVLRVEALARAGAHEALLALEAPLLGTLSYEDCQEFDAWLLAARKRLDAHWAHAAAVRLDALEREGAFREALALAEQQVRRQPTCEEACRRVMRLYHLTGDRHAVRHAYQRLCTQLHAQLGVEPEPETRQLADALERRVGTAVPPVPSRGPLPLSLLRPPVLVEREAAWGALEEGWARGQLLVVTGERGVGKTRLALDFAEHQGPVAHLEARAGDGAVPLAFLTRMLRQLLAARPDVALPGWVRQALSRLLPELATDGPSPAAAAEDGLRLLEAQAEALRLTTSHLSAVVVDEAHALDEASRDVLLALLSREAPLGRAGGLTPWVWCVRTDALTPGGRAALAGAVGSGLAHPVVLAPLSAEGVRALLRSVRLAGTEAVAGALFRYAGGNPLLTLETLRHAQERGALARGDWQPCAPERARVQLRLRLEGLSPRALQLAQLAALAEADFGLELAAAVLEVSPLSLTPAVDELAARGLLKDEHLTCGLLAEVLRDSLPGPTRALLLGRVAALRAPPARVRRAPGRAGARPEAPRGARLPAACA